MPVRLLAGLETEYAVAVPDGGVRGMAPHDVCSEMLAVARRIRRYLRAGGGGGIFLGNGSRLYIDTGGHPELATPETDNPDDCVRYAVAGDMIVGAILAEVARTHPGARGAVLYKCNVDYARPGTTWAAHESYLHRCSPSNLPDQLIPHLVSRVIYGAGGLESRCPGIRFSLSPRAHMFVTDVSECSTSTRGIYHTRNEPLAPQGFHRLHVICGDSLCSHLALWLKVASTAMIVGLVDAGLEPAAQIMIKHPVKSLHAFAGDPSLTATAVTRDGPTRTAVQLQRHYLEQVEAGLEHLPDWAPGACARWRDLLDRLETGPASAETCLDWGTKHALFMDRVRGRGFDPATLPHWNDALKALQQAQRRRRTREPLRSASFARDFPRPVGAVAAMLAERGLDWARLPELLHLREELCEIDVRFTQIEPAGLFTMLEDELDHRVPGVDRFDEACEDPPANTRAALRGRCVKRFSGRDRFEAGWEYVTDARGRFLDLSDPFRLDARWARRQMPRRRRHHPFFMSLHNEISVAYNRGDFGGILQRLGPLALDFGLDEGFPELLPYRAWALSRTGRLAGAIEALDRLAGLRGHGAALAADYVAVYRFQPLVPREPALWRWIERADALADAGSLDRGVLATHLGHRGYALARRGDLDAAAVSLRRACGINTLPGNLQRVVARNYCDLADVLRLQGRRAEASGWLDRAAEIFRRHDYGGEHADHYVATRARLEHDEDRPRVRRMLSRARSVQRVLGRPTGLARTLLLDARIAGTPVTARRRREAILELLRASSPDLQSCPRLSTILDRWDEWTGDPAVTVDDDPFWMV